MSVGTFIDFWRRTFAFCFTFYVHHSLNLIMNRSCNHFGEGVRMAWRGKNGLGNFYPRVKNESGVILDCFTWILAETRQLFFSTNASLPLSGDRSTATIVSEEKCAIYNLQFSYVFRQFFIDLLYTLWNVQHLLSLQHTILYGWDMLIYNSM